MMIKNKEKLVGTYILQSTCDSLNSNPISFLLYGKYIYIKYRMFS